MKVLKKRTELLTVDVVKENNLAASLSIFVFDPILVTFTSIFLLEMMLKTVIMLAKKQKTLVSLWWGARGHFTTSKDKKILMKINLVLLDDTVNGYLTWKNLLLNHLLHVVTLKGTNSFIQMSWMNLFLTHFAVNAKAILCNSDDVRKGLDEPSVVYLMFICLVVSLMNVSLMQLLTKFRIIMGWPFNQILLS